MSHATALDVLLASKFVVSTPFLNTLEGLGRGGREASRRLSKRARFCVHFYDIVLVCVFLFFFILSFKGGRGSLGRPLGVLGVKGGEVSRGVSV